MLVFPVEDGGLLGGRRRLALFGPGGATPAVHGCMSLGSAFGAPIRACAAIVAASCAKIGIGIASNRPGGGAFSYEVEGEATGGDGAGGADESPNAHFSISGQV